MIQSIRNKVSQYLPNFIKADFHGLFIRIRSSLQVIILSKPLDAIDKIKIIFPQGKRSKYIFVNGEKVYLQSSEISKVFLCDPKYFHQWENIVAIPEMDNGNSSFSIEFSYHDANDDQKNITVNDYFTKTDRSYVPNNNSFTSEIASIGAAWSFIINCRNDDSSSMYSGTYYGCFDETFRTYRLASWIWCNATVIKAMVLESELSKSEVARLSWLNKAIELGDILLKRWSVENKDNKNGGMVIRWDISQSSPTGIVPWRAPNDVAYLAAYGFCSLYKATGLSKYLDAAIEIGDWVIEHGLTTEGQLYVGYRDDLQKWETNWLYVDAGFTSRLFSELATITQDSKWSYYLKLFMDWYIKAFYSHRGFFYWSWSKKPWRNVSKIFTRGQAWALDGLIASYDLIQSDHFLFIANEVVRKLVNSQSEDGSWPYLLGRASSGACNKGTPIIAYHLLQLYKWVNDPEILLVTQKALSWCEKNQCDDKEDYFKYGGIFATNTEGSITGEKNVSTSFLYSTAYYIMAKHLMTNLENHHD